MNLFNMVAYASEKASTAGEASTAEVGAAGGFAAMAVQLMPLVFIILIFYFFIIRPQRKRDKETRAMLDALKVGDKVVTIGGICGKVTKLKDTYVFIETGNIGTETEKSTIKMERAAIKSVETKVKN